MKKIFILMLIILTILLNNFVLATEFSDIENHWAKEEIKEAILNDIINGYEDKSFKPNNSVTVAEYLKIIVKSAHFDLVRKGLNPWPDYYIDTALENGLILENEFSDYNKKLTRNEVARINARYINVEDIKESKTKFKDADNDYKEEIQKLVKLEVIKGYEDNTFRGEENVTRAESIVIAKRATNARRSLITTRKYSDEEKIKLSNIKSPNEETLSYEIKNNKIYTYDYGRYSNLQNYEVNDENINISRVCKIINTLIDEDSYTEVLYVPDKNIFNQLIIRCGENKSQTTKGMSAFEIIYYEDKPYELKRISLEDKFSENCYMKIELFKMWRDNAKLQEKIYIDEYKKEKLGEVIEIEFGTRYKNEILDYMIKKYERHLSRENYGEREVEVKTFGKFVVNYYKTADGDLRFYISQN